MKKIIEKIKKRKNKIGIIGLGYVGLPLAIRFSEEKFNVTGFDIDKEKVGILNTRKSFIKHIPNKKIANIVQMGFNATNDFSIINNIDNIIICVPTPLGVHNEPDLSYIQQTLKEIGPYLRKNQLLILESTTYPGTTDEKILPFLQDLNFEIGL